MVSSFFFFTWYLKNLTVRNRKKSFLQGVQEKVFSKVKCYHKLTKLSNYGMFPDRTISKLKFYNTLPVLDNIFWKWNTSVNKTVDTGIIKTHIVALHNICDGVVCNQRKQLIESIFTNGTVNTSASYSQLLVQTGYHRMDNTN